MVLVKKHFFYFILVFFFTSCSKKNVSFSYHVNSVKRTCKFSFDKEFTLKKMIDDHGLREWLIEFPTQGKIFITNDEINGSEINDLKVKKFGRNVSLKFIQDSLTLEGLDSSGFWKEIKQGGLVYGYMNVKENDKAYFEKSIVPNCK